MAAVDPYTVEILASFPRRSGWYNTADNIHGSLLLGAIGAPDACVRSLL